MSKLMTAYEALTMASSNCVHPVRAIQRNGLALYVRCGQCVCCLKSRRQELAYRLEQERKVDSCFDAFGFTYTYDSEHLPCLPREVLENSDALSNNPDPTALYRLNYIHPNNSHSYLQVDRGATAEQLTSGEMVGLLYPKDVTDVIKRIRKQLQKRYPLIVLRYYVHCEYGELDNHRTGRPHYHGIIYLHDCHEKSQRLKPKALQTIGNYVRNLVLEKWVHSARKYDRSKGIYYGKDLHKFGAGWGNYLGKYIAKSQVAGFAGCLGIKYIPEQSLCSRRNDRYGLKSLGMTDYDVTPWFAELQTAERLAQLWQPTRTIAVNDKMGGKKCMRIPLYNCEKRAIIEAFFGITISRHEAHRLLYSRYGQQRKGRVNLGSSPRPLRNSIQCSPSVERTWTIRGEYTEAEEEAFTRYDRFIDTQLRANMSSRLGTINPNGYYIVNATRDSWKPLHHAHRLEAMAFATLRQKVLMQAAETEKRALDYKYRHAINNQYV